jgi:DNA-binding FrmR family transcriptional regulator
MKNKPSSAHHDHSSSLKRLNRAKGQIEAVQRMIEDRRYCMDIIMQIRAARAALRGLEASILETHLHGCVANALKAKNPDDADTKIRELMRIFDQTRD